MNHKTKYTISSRAALPVQLDPVLSDHPSGYKVQNLAMWRERLLYLAAGTPNAYKKTQLLEFCHC